MIVRQSNKSFFVGVNAGVSGDTFVICLPDRIELSSLPESALTIMTSSTSGSLPPMELMFPLKPLVAESLTPFLIYSEEGWLATEPSCIFS